MSDTPRKMALALQNLWQEPSNRVFSEEDIRRCTERAEIAVLLENQRLLNESREPVLASQFKIQRIPLSWQHIRASGQPIRRAIRKKKSTEEKVNWNEQGF